MINNYYKALDHVSFAEKTLLVQFIDELRNSLKPGMDSLNWNSLGIPDFIQKCEGEINKFQSVVNQVQKNASMISSVVESIATTVLVPPVKFQSQTDIYDMQVRTHFPFHFLFEIS